MYSGRQTQAPAPFCSLHSAFAPHGEGTQGVEGSGTLIIGMIS